MIGLVVGTGPSLRQQLHLIPKFDGLVFTCNNSYQDIRTDVWLACDPAWHQHQYQHYGPVRGDFDKWHWDREICVHNGYTYVEGVWLVEGKAYPRSEYITPPGPCGGLWMEDQSRISLNHCSGAQLLNLACNQYGCETVLLIGHDFRYDSAQPRHYFKGLSDVDGEYPQALRKFSEFDKKGRGDDLLAVYKRISETPDIPRIVNVTPDSALPWFEFDDFENYLQ